VPQPPTHLRRSHTCFLTLPFYLQAEPGWVPQPGATTTCLLLTLVSLHHPPVLLPAGRRITRSPSARRDQGEGGTHSVKGWRWHTY
jgi:hypothetical protein